jgi:hypothetical protein
MSLGYPANSAESTSSAHISKISIFERPGTCTPFVAFFYRRKKRPGNTARLRVNPELAHGRRCQRPRSALAASATKISIRQCAASEVPGVPEPGELWGPERAAHKKSPVPRTFHARAGVPRSRGCNWPKDRIAAPRSPDRAPMRRRPSNAAGGISRRGEGVGESSTVTGGTGPSR